MQSLGHGKKGFFLNTLRLAITFTLCFMLVAPPPLYAQSVLNLPSPGTLVALSPAFAPTTLLGLEIDPQNPFKFQFIVDRGDQEMSPEEIQRESAKVIRYFLAGLAVPENALWVNLSPYEGDRIVDDIFGQTEMGRDLLAQDYMLKQITASLIYPEDDFGRAFWKRIYQKAYEAYGTTTIPMNTFNKVWIMPDKATVYEHQNKAIIIESAMKVMLEQDYLSLEHNLFNDNLGLSQQQQEQLTKQVSSISSDVVRDVVLPELSKEVNAGKNFAQLRQIYNSLILANWFKKNLKQALLNKIYSNQNKIDGISIDDKEATKQIYEQYLAAFKKGVCDMIKVEYDPYMKKQIPRKYFSGGFVASSMIVSTQTGPEAQAKISSILAGLSAKAKDRLLRVYAAVVGGAKDVINFINNNPLVSTLSAAAVFSLFNPAEAKILNVEGAGNKIVITQNDYRTQAVAEASQALSGKMSFDAPVDDGTSTAIKTTRTADEGFFKDIAIVNQETYSIGGVFYGDVKYTDTKFGTEVKLGQRAETTLYFDEAMTQQIGVLTVTRFPDGTLSDYLLTFSDNKAMAERYGWTGVKFTTSEKLEIEMRNLLLSQASLYNFASSLSQLAFPGSHADLQSRQPDLYNLNQALNESGLEIVPEDLVSVSNAIKEGDLKTRNGSKDFYEMTLREKGQTSHINYHVQMRIVIEFGKSPRWQYRIFRVSSDNKTVVLLGRTENFTNAMKRSDFEYSGINNYWAEALDFNYMSKVFGRVVAALPAIYPSTQDYQNADPITQQVNDRVRKNMGNLPGNGAGKTGDGKIHVAGNNVNAVSPAGSGAARLVMQNGQSTFAVEAGDFSRGETVFVGDRSGTMTKKKFEAMVKAFQKIWTGLGIEKIFFGDVANENAPIEEIATKDLLTKMQQDAQGEGSTSWFENIFAGSKKVGRYGTISYVGDFRPDSLRIGIHDWSYADVEKQFNLLAQQMKDSHQRFIGYYIKSPDYPGEPPLIQLMKKYAAEHSDNPIFFVVEQAEEEAADSDNIQKFEEEITKKYGESQEVRTIPIGDLSGLGDSKIAFIDEQGNPIMVVDKSGQSLPDSSFKSRGQQTTRGVVTFNYRTGQVEGYSVPKGTRKIVVSPMGKQTEARPQVQDVSLFVFIDKSASMDGNGQLERIKNFWRNGNWDKKKQVMGVSSFDFRDTPQETEFFDEGTSERRINNAVTDLRVAGNNTRFLAPLKATLDRLLSLDRPKRNQPGFTELRVPVLTDGANRTEVAKLFTPEYVQDLYDHGIVLDFLFVTPSFPFDVQDYIPRVKDMFDSRGQGYAELAAGTGGLMLKDVDPAALFREYSRVLDHMYSGQIPDGIGVTEIVAYDEAGNVLDRGFYETRIDGEFNDFHKKQMQQPIVVSAKVFRMETVLGWTDTSGVFHLTTPQEVRRIAQEAFDKGTDLKVWVRDLSTGGLKQVILGQDVLKTLIVVNAKKNGKSAETAFNRDQSRYDQKTQFEQQRKKESEKYASRGVSSILGSDKKGGIDFNADQFDLKTQGEGIDMNVPFDESMLKDFNPAMIAPVIINIVPLSNPQMFLGLTDQPAEAST